MMCSANDVVHPVPLAGPAAQKPLERRLLRLAGRLSAWRRLQRRLDARGARARQGRRSRIGPTAPRTRTGCRATTSCRARCTRAACAARCHDVHGTANDADLRQARSDVCLKCHGAAVAERPARPTIEQHTHHSAGQRGQHASPATCRRSRGRSATSTCAATPSSSSRRRATERYKVPNPCTTCHTRQDDRLGDRDDLRNGRTSRRGACNSDRGRALRSPRWYPPNPESWVERSRRCNTRVWAKPV